MSDGPLSSNLESIPATEYVDGNTKVFAQNPNDVSGYVTLNDIDAYIQANKGTSHQTVPFRGAMVFATTGAVLGNGPGLINTWNTEILDTDNIWNPGTPDRLIVPSGASYVRLWAELSYGYFSTSPTTRLLMIAKNGVYPPDYMGAGGITGGIPSTTGTTTTYEATTAVIPVTAGDYFQVWFYQTSYSLLVFGGAPSYFAMEVIV